MGNRFFYREHDIDGEIYLELDGETVKFSCRWPFDLDEDDWIYVFNSFPLEDYLQSIRTLGNKKEVSVKGIKNGKIHLSMLDDSKIKIHAIDDRSSQGPQIDIAFDAKPADFIPLGV